MIDRMIAPHDRVEDNNASVKDVGSAVFLLVSTTSSSAWLVRRSNTARGHSTNDRMPVDESAAVGRGVVSWGWGGEDRVEFVKIRVFSTGAVREVSYPVL